MIIAMIAISALVLAACISVAVIRLRRIRTPAELRGNWWADFERQFRDHAAEVARQRPRAPERSAGRESGRDGSPAKRPPTTN